MSQQDIPKPLDALIIGAGPAGIAIAHTFSQSNVNYLVLEKGAIGEHISHYPTFMEFFSTRENLEIAAFPLGVTAEKPSRREYLRYLVNFVNFHRLRVETFTRVLSVRRKLDGLHDVTVQRHGREPETITAATVIIAVGAWDSPRSLGIPGEDLPKVHKRYTESHSYVGKKVLIIGGRNSAIDTALELWRAGAQVSICHRGKDFTGVGVKYWLLPDIENRIKNGEITGYLNSHVRSIDWTSVDIELGNGSTTTVANDFVLPMLGYDPPVKFLRSLGVRLEPGTNRPLHNPATLEVDGVPGLFIAGVITNGNVSGKVFIENSRHHGELILPRLREILKG